MAPSDPHVMIRLVQDPPAEPPPTMRQLADGLDACRSDARLAAEWALAARSESAGCRADIRAQGDTLADIGAALIRLEATQAAAARGAAVGAAAGVGGVGGVVGVGAAVDAVLGRLPAGVAPWAALALLVMIAVYVAARRFRR